MAPLKVSWPAGWMNLRRKPTLPIAAAGVFLLGAIGVGIFFAVSGLSGSGNSTVPSSGTISNIGSGSNSSEQEFPTASALVPSPGEVAKGTISSGTAVPPGEASQQTSANVSAQATLEVGTASGAPGEQVTLPINVRTGGAVVRGMRVNLLFDGNALTSPEGSAGVDLPPGWTFASFSPAPGELRLLAINSTGQPFSGVVFTATFTVDDAAAAGEVAVTVALEEVRDDANLALSLGVADGMVTVRSPGG